MNQQEQLNKLQDSVDRIDGEVDKNARDTNDNFARAFSYADWFKDAVDHIVRETGIQPPRPYKEPAKQD